VANADFWESQSLSAFKKMSHVKTLSIMRSTNHTGEKYFKYGLLDSHESKKRNRILIKNYSLYSFRRVALIAFEILYKMFTCALLEEFEFPKKFIYLFS